MHASLIYSLYQIGAIKFGDFTLKSGQTSKIYLDVRQIISYPGLLKNVANLLCKQVKTKSFDLICGVPYTALPIATCMSLELNIPMIMRRKEKKSYGTKQLIEGCYHQGQTCLVIEDVITSGQSILETTNELEECGLDVSNVVALIDRQQGGRDNLERKGYHVHAVFTLQKILNDLMESTIVSSVDREKLIQEIER